MEMTVAAKSKGASRGPKKVSRYEPPSAIHQTTLQTLLAQIGQPQVEAKQLSLLASDDAPTADIPLWYSGDPTVLRNPSVAVVGAREVSPQGAARARRIARELAERGVTVVSGLAAGVDTYALTSAIEAGGRVAAVIGTPMSKATPVDNADLQSRIYRDHVLVSQFAEGTDVHKANFPKRNRTMAALTRGTLIVEASDTSGTLHQAVECTRLKRWLFVLRSVVESPDLAWPKKFQSTYDRFVVVESVEDILQRIKSDAQS